MGVIIALFLIYWYQTQRQSQSGGSGRTKCFSCEAQDEAMGIRNRFHSSKCFSCEEPDGIHVQKLLSNFN